MNNVNPVDSRETIFALHDLSAHSIVTHTRTRPSEDAHKFRSQQSQPMALQHYSIKFSEMLLKKKCLDMWQNRAKNIKRVQSIMHLSQNLPTLQKLI